MTSRLASMARVLLFFLIFQAHGNGQLPKGVPPVTIAPDVSNIPYGPHERNVLDLWKTKVRHQAPLLVFIHGGSFTHGDKRDRLPDFLVKDCLKNGISVASINYRYSTQAPYPAPWADSVRAVQFLRLHAAEYDLNPKAFAATGGSAGAVMSLWIGFHDDMADPTSNDPVRRQSTRLCGMAVSNGQTTVDPRTIARLITPGMQHDGLRTLFGMKPGVDPLEAKEYFKLYEDASPVTHLTRDDPPVFLYYSNSNTPMPPATHGIGIHHPRFGYFLKEKMDNLGIECIVRVKDDYEGQPAEQYLRDWVQFYLKRFPKR